MPNIFPYGYEEMPEVSFTVESGEIYVGDPCYERNTSLNTILPAENGLWYAGVLYNEEGRVARLMAVKDGYSYGFSKYYGDYELPVDSGQMSVWDNGDYASPGWSYEEVCELTLSREKCGTLEHGCASSSGWGDGCYLGMFYCNDNEEVICVEIVFIDDDYEEEDEEEYDF